MCIYRGVFCYCRSRTNAAGTAAIALAAIGQMVL